MFAPVTLLSSRLPVPRETLVLKLIQFFLQLESFKFVPVLPKKKGFCFIERRVLLLRLRLRPPAPPLTVCLYFSNPEQCLTDLFSP